MQYNKIIMIFLCALDKNVLWVYVFLWVHFLSEIQNSYPRWD